MSTDTTSGSTPAVSGATLAHSSPADPGSVSGEHLGRLAGLRNWKRNGCWVNVLNPYSPPRPPWDPTPALDNPPVATATTNSPPASIMAMNQTSGDPSPSAKEWGWVCGALQAGIKPNLVYQKLLQRASARRGSDAQRYARYTLQRALQRLKSLSTLGGPWFIRATCALFTVFPHFYAATNTSR